VPRPRIVEIAKQILKFGQATQPFLMLPSWKQTAKELARIAKLLNPDPRTMQFGLIQLEQSLPDLPELPRAPAQDLCGATSDWVVQRSPLVICWVDERAVPPALNLQKERHISRRSQCILDCVVCIDAHRTALFRNRPYRLTVRPLLLDSP
jgi:hypothetical protein